MMKKPLTLLVVTLAIGAFIPHTIYALEQKNSQKTFETNTAYHRLESMLPLYKQAVRHPWAIITSNQILRKGMQGEPVVLLYKRLCKTRDLQCEDDRSPDFFDEEIEAGVRSFQERHNLKPDGVVGMATLTALNVSPKVRLQQIQVNLTRLKYFIQKTEPNYIWINVPDCRLRLVKNHQPVVTFPVIAGKISRKTPEIDSKVTRVILNPCWNVPPTILKNDVIPKASANPNYLKNGHIRVFSASAPQKELSPQQINWKKIKQSPGSYIFRQDPGLHNALGKIKFDFENSHSIYLHDTAHKELFEAEKRLLSSGCIRLKDPLLFLSHLIEIDPLLSKEKISIESAVQSNNTTFFKLQKPFPIHITYITAWVDSDGKLHFWEDVYNHDQQLVIQKSDEEKDLAQPV